MSIPWSSFAKEMEKGRLWLENELGFDSQISAPIQSQMLVLRPSKYEPRHSLQKRWMYGMWRHYWLSTLHFWMCLPLRTPIPTQDRGHRPNSYPNIGKLVSLENPCGLSAWSGQWAPPGGTNSGINREDKSEERVNCSDLFICIYSIPVQAGQ